MFWTCLWRNEDEALSFAEEPSGVETMGSEEVVLFRKRYSLREAKRAQDHRVCPLLARPWLPSPSDMEPERNWSISFAVGGRWRQRCTTEDSWPWARTVTMGSEDESILRVWTRAWMWRS